MKELLALVALTASTATGQGLDLKEHKDMRGRRTASSSARLAQVLELIQICIECVRDPACEEYDADADQYYQEMLELLQKSGKASASAIKTFENDLLTPWNEGPDSVTREFWRRIKGSGLPYVRRDGLRDLLKRGKIGSRSEYELAVDAIDGAVQSGRITTDENERLGKMISKFETKGRKK